ncbi:unnamed protein product, partial [Clonostachys chloroleuca]
ACTIGFRLPFAIITAIMDELRFRSQHSPRNENPVTSFVSPNRNGSRALQQQGQPASLDTRSVLPRRFTTDSSRVPTLSSMSITSPQRGPDHAQDYNLEQKKAEYERIVNQRRRFELEMQILDQRSRREAAELAQLEEEVVRVTGHQSEPTTPPEHYSGFPSALSRPSRYSMSSLTSPPGFQSRSARSGSQLTSPPAGMIGGSRYGWDDHLPSRSVPITRRNSDDEERDEAVRQDPTSHRSTHAINRYSMPVTRSRNGLYETGLDATNTARFLFGDEDAGAAQHANAIDQGFPTLVRRDDQILSASSAALDLALSSSPAPEGSVSHHWSSHINRHRTQQSLSSINGNSSGLSEINTLSNRPASLRQSLDLKYISENASEAPSPGAVTPGSHAMTTPPKMQSPFSPSDGPSVKNMSGSSIQGGNANNHAQQHFHNHNASMGRIPSGVAPTRGHSRELSAESNSATARDPTHQYQSLQSALQASAAPFGPSVTTTAQQPSVPVTAPPNLNMMNGFNGYYPPNGYVPANGVNGPPANYQMNMLNAGMQQMNVNGVAGGNVYPNGNFGAGGGYSAVPFNQASQPPRDSQARVIQHRRQLDNEVMSRYQNMPLESFRGQIYDLCKDQHGCRYFQKKLEERNPEQVHMIWLETNMHVIELMTDPFGNYLCQKLLEFCNDDERTVLIKNASQDMVRIALNQHGTRALQKMIEHVNLPQHVQLIIEALRFRVVELIQDLNGNHVIQKCLNKLSSADAQFIFDAVGNNCVEVGTHRHGCCVLQRCIDHASGDQKLWLIQRITEHSRILVQDPFGNYVVQYIIDLNEPTFTEPVVAMFQGCISALSRHKFSSNVIEKCLRCAQTPSKDMIVEEMLSPQEMERLLRDSFANYVVQTALEYSTPHQKHRLVEAIRPILPQIRSTPYGRRIQAKISAYDNRGSAASSGQVTPADNTQGQIPLRTGHPRTLSGSSSMLQSNGSANGAANGFGQSAPSTMSNAAPVPTPSTQGGPVQPPQATPLVSAPFNGAQAPANNPPEGAEAHWV